MMLKNFKKSLVLIIIFYLSYLCVYVPRIEAQEFEKGDAIYREGSLPGSWFLGHAGLYLFWSAALPPSNWSSQYTIEALLSGVTITDFYSFYYAGPPFWGVGYSSSLTYYQRNAIITTALNQRGLPYSFFEGYKSPGVSFRCDGLVEYCYEQVGIDIINDHSWDQLWPSLQYNALGHRSNAYVYKSEITSPYPNSFIRGVTNIRAFVSDGGEDGIPDPNKGSGIRRTKFFYYDLSSNKVEIGIDNGTADVERVASIDWSTASVLDGPYELESVAFDQAGNYLQSGKLKVNVDNTPPQVTASASPTVFEVSYTEPGDETDDPNMPNETTITCDFIDPQPAAIPEITYTVHISIAIQGIRSFVTYEPLVLTWNGSNAYVGSYSVIWDGTDNAGQKVDVGTYKILAEAVDLAGNLGDNSIRNDTVYADPTFLQLPREGEIAIFTSPLDNYNWLGYPEPESISILPSNPNNISIYKQYSKDLDAELTLPQDALTEDAVITLNDTDSSGSQSQMVKPQYNLEPSEYIVGIESSIDSNITIDTQYYIAQAVSRGMDEQEVTAYINNIINSAQSNLSNYIESTATSTLNEILPQLSDINSQVITNVEEVIDETLARESRFSSDKALAIAKANAENSVDDVIAKLKDAGASDETISRIKEEAKAKAESQAAYNISLLEAAKYNDVKALHDDANLNLQNLIYDTNQLILLKNLTLKRNVLDEKDIIQSNAEKEIINYIFNPQDTTSPVAQITSPADNQTISGTVKIYGTITDSNLRDYSVTYFDGISWVELNKPDEPDSPHIAIWNTRQVLNGEYKLKLRAFDEAGNVSRHTILVNVNNPDTKSPVISFDSPAQNEEVPSIVSVIGSIKEDYLLNYIVEYSTQDNPNNWIQISSQHKIQDPSGVLINFSSILLPQGTHSIRITAIDTSQNQTQKMMTVLTGHKLDSQGGHLYASDALADKLKLKFAHKSYQIKPNGLELASSATIKIKYSDQYLTDCGYEEDLLSLFLWNDDKNSWEVMPTQIDFENNILSSQITKFGIYAIREYKPELIDNTNPIAQITNLTFNSQNNLITVTGTANDENLDYYMVEVGSGESPTIWTGYENSPKVIIDSQLAVIDAKDWVPGIYSVRLIVVDQTGNTSSTTGNLTIGQGKIVGLKISTPYIAPEVQSQDVSKQVEITYQLLQDAYITVKIKDDDAEIVILSNNQFQPAGNQKLTWDGKDALGNFVTPKTYTIEVSSSTGTQATTEIEVRDLIAKISVPVKDSIVRGYVPIWGLACGKNFESYTLEYGEGENPAAWTNIISSLIPQTKDVTYGNLIVVDRTLYGNLATWDTGLSNYVYGVHPVDLNGTYTLRLTSKATTGKQEEFKVTVFVGRVIPNIYGGTVESPDNKVVLSIPAQAIIDSFELLSITALPSTSVSIPQGYNVIGNIYQIQPAGETFTKEVTLTMSYTDSDLGSLDEAKLGIYVYSPFTKNWEYLATSRDAIQNKLTTTLTSIMPQVAYYAILGKTKLPDKPVLYSLSDSVSQLNVVTITGKGSVNEKIELYVNDQLRGTIPTDNILGLFSLQVLLDLGQNTIVAYAVDEFGQRSEASNPLVHQVVESQPLAISSVRFMDSNYSVPYTGSVYIGDTLYMELTGTDLSLETIDATTVNLTSSITDPSGISIQLIETDKNTGKYRGIAYISMDESSALSRKIRALANGEEVKVISSQDSTKFDTLQMVDNVPPNTPSITSQTHPSVCQDTFEDGFNQWQNRDGQVGATLILDDTQTPNGTNVLKLINTNDGGNFASTIRTTEFDAKEYPFVLFDYKIPDDIKINFLVKVKDKWYDIIFTDDPKRYWRLNLEEVGRIKDVIADGNWHNTSFNLYEMFKSKPDAFEQDGRLLIKEFIMADWDDKGYMKLEYGTNKEGATYYVDNFIISKPGYSNPNPQFTILGASDPSGIAGYSYLLNLNPDTIPDETIDGTSSIVSYSNLEDGIYYFHTRARDNASNWSHTNHYKVLIDTKGPQATMPKPEPYSRSGYPTISINIKDEIPGTGVDPATIKLKVEDWEYDLSNKALKYDIETGTLTFTPSSIGIIFADGQLINVELTQANDYCGNPLQNPMSWEWVVDYNLDTTAPQAPVITSPTISDITKDEVTFVWEAQDPNGILGYSFILDNNPLTIPDEISEGLITSKTYSSLSEGEWYFHVKAKDRAGNWSQASHAKVNLKEEALVVNDFNDGSEPNNLAGFSGRFENPEGGTCIESYYNENPANIYEGNFSLKLQYDVRNITDYAGYWTQLNNLNLSQYEALSFWIKGEMGGDILRIGLKDSKGNEPKVRLSDFLSSGVTQNWQKIVIPLSRFVKEGADLTSVDSVTLAFENWMGATEGIVYIDLIQFENKVSPYIIDNFNDGGDPNATLGPNWTFSDGFSVINTGYTQAHSYDNSEYGYYVEFSGVTPYTYGGWVIYLDGIDVSDNNTLSFYIKGKDGNERPNIYLSDGVNNKFVDIEKYATITTSWKKVNIPLIEFTNQGINLKDLQNIKFVFEWDYMESTIYVDDVKFETILYPYAPELELIANLTNQNELTISGKAKPGSKVTLVVEIEGVGIWEMEPIIVDESGVFTTIVYIYGDGHKTIYAYVTDPDGNRSIASAKQTVILDRTQPPTPTLADIDTPRRDPHILASGIAETSSTVYVKVTQPRSGIVEYAKEAENSTYYIDINLTDGDGTYSIVATSKDDAGNWSAETSPKQIVLDAINQTPLVSLSYPTGKELLSFGTYAISYFSSDSDPTDTLKVDIKYTNSSNQNLVDNFDDLDEQNLLGGWSGTWAGNGGLIGSQAIEDPYLTYERIGASRRLSYDVTQQNSYAGYWTGIYTQPDMSNYTHISFLVKREIGDELFKIGLKDNYNNEMKLLITDYLKDPQSNEWQKVTMPLSDFAGVNVANLNNFSITFENSLQSKASTIYIDEMRFIKWVDIAVNLASEGTYSWDITGLGESTRYLAKAIAKDDRGLKKEQESDDYFIITNSFLDNFDGKKRIEVWWDSDGTLIYQKSLDTATSYEGQTSMKVVYNKQNLPWSFFAAHPYQDGINNNLSGFTKLAFFVKGDVKIKVKLEDTQGRTWEQDSFTITPDTEDWEQLSYDLMKATTLDLSQITNILFFVAPGEENVSGAFYMDGVYLSVE